MNTTEDTTVFKLEWGDDGDRVSTSVRIPEEWVIDMHWLAWLTGLEQSEVFRMWLGMGRFKTLSDPEEVLRSAAEVMDALGVEFAPPEIEEGTILNPPGAAGLLIKTLMESGKWDGDRDEAARFLQARIRGHLENKVFGQGLRT